MAEWFQYWGLSRFNRDYGKKNALLRLKMPVQADAAWASLHACRLFVYREDLMRNRFNKFASWVCAVVCLIVTASKATTVVPPTFEEMADRADVIFVGNVVSSRAEWRTSGTNRVIFTMVEFETQDVLKGSNTKKVTLQFLGGTVDDVTLEVPGVPKFKPGERVLIFVEGNGVQFCPIAGVFHGKFGLKKDEKSGLEIVVMHDGKALQDTSEIGSGEGAELSAKRAMLSVAADKGPMSVDAFKLKIQDRLRKQTDKK